METKAVGLGGRSRMPAFRPMAQGRRLAAPSGRALDPSKRFTNPQKLINSPAGLSKAPALAFLFCGRTCARQGHTKRSARSMRTSLFFYLRAIYGANLSYVTMTYDSSSYQI
jgi:hypothetical protein